MFSSAIKGWYGEFCGNLAHHIYLDPKIYVALNDVTIPAEDGETTQIDHILVSQYGIFVIEAKYMDGWIFGSEYQALWTQSFPTRKFKFQNPLRQNYRHTKALSYFLDIEHDKFHSVVMFWGDSQFKTIMPPNVLDKGYSAYIKSKDDLLFTSPQVQQIIHAIEKGALPRSWKTHFSHVENLKSKFRGVESKTYCQEAIDNSKESRNLIQNCPKCGSNLVLRTAKKGNQIGTDFLGCSNFPKCRHISNIDD